jgi:formate dehydrogenase maturation protein FdhE
MNKIKERRKVGAICSKCQSPDYKYLGRTGEPDGKHQFKCNSCGKEWHYGRNDSKFLQLK